MKLRTLLFWTHLTAGLVAGIVILIMSVTGTLLTFQQSVLKVIERSQRFVEVPAGAGRLDVDVLLARVRQAVPDAEPTTVTLDSDPRVSASVALGQRGTVFVNPYTGDVLGSGSARARAFYRSVTSWHRYLSVEGEHRATARAITGACNAAFLVLAISGIYLWWPRQWTWRHVSAVTLFRSGLRGKARDFNWHNVIGFWCAPILVVLTASGMVISYTWASNLVYTLTGSPRPAAAAGRGGGPGAEAGGRGGGRGRGSEPVRNEARTEARSEPGGRPIGRRPRRARRWRQPGGHARIARGARRTSGAHMAHDDPAPAATPGRTGGHLDVRPRPLEQLRPLDADARRPDREPTSAGNRTPRPASARRPAAGCASRTRASSAASRAKPSPARLRLVEDSSSGPAWRWPCAA